MSHTVAEFVFPGALGHVGPLALAVWLCRREGERKEVSFRRKLDQWEFVSFFLSFERSLFDLVFGSGSFLCYFSLATDGWVFFFSFVGGGKFKIMSVCILQVGILLYEV